MILALLSLTLRLLCVGGVLGVVVSWVPVFGFVGVGFVIVGGCGGDGVVWGRRCVCS